MNLRKYEDWPIPLLAGPQYTYDYLPHSFEPALDYSALARLLATLVEQQNSAVVSITIRPQRLNTLEIPMLYVLLGWNQELLKGNRTYGQQDIPNPFRPLTEALVLPDISVLHFKQRAALGCEIYEDLTQQWQTLFLTRLQVIGIPRAEQTLVEVLGSEVVANIDNPIPGLWSPVSPASEGELYWARFNTQWLEFSRWGITHATSPLARLRQFATVDEVFGAFRLPIASGIVLDRTNDLLSKHIPELLHHGTACLLIDDRPDLFNEQLISNASTVLVTACQSTQVHRYIANQLALSQTDMLRMQRLRDNEAIISVPQQNTVLIDIS